MFLDKPRDILNLVLFRCDGCLIEHVYQPTDRFPVRPSAVESSVLWRSSHTCWRPAGSLITPPTHESTSKRHHVHPEGGRETLEHRCCQLFHGGQMHQSVTMESLNAASLAALSSLRTPPCCDLSPRCVSQVARSADRVHRELHRVVRGSVRRDGEREPEPGPGGPVGILRPAGTNQPATGVRSTAAQRL